MTLLAVALALIAGGGVLAAIAWRRPSLSSALAVCGAVLGGALGELVAVRALLRGDVTTHVLPWAIPYGQIHVALDPLSSFFLVPVFGLPAVSAIYGRSYLPSKHNRRKAFHWLAFNLLMASMACVVIARQAVLFLVAWELMSICAFVLVTFEHEQAAVTRAGWTYLIATHISVSFLIALFMLLARQAGGFDFDAMGAMNQVPRSLVATVFALALVGFGTKAGLVPLHVWLPEAHAAAPSHVSAVMSGVVIKMGLYGLLRVLLLIGHPATWWGPTLIVFGILGGLVGISLALYQRDLKRVLAYSSVENIGIILIGLGTGFWGFTAGHPHVAVLGMTAALLHVWNHTLLKGLLFLGAGSVLHATGTKDLERLGGLMKRMPRTATCMVVGAVGLAALPPMNGFASEWLAYLGLTQGLLASGAASSVATSIAVAFVALIGALTVLCFVRLIGIALLGTPRSAPASDAHESPVGMTGPILFLTAMCVGVAVVPQVFARALGNATTQLLGGSRVEATVATDSLSTLAKLDVVLVAFIAIGAIASHFVLRSRTTDETWGCGYAAPSARMQYTSRSFAELIVARLLPGRLGPRMSITAPKELFAERAMVESDCTDPVTRGVYEPFLSRWGDRLARIRWVQQGSLHAYLVYILVVVLVLLTWSSLRTWSGE